MSQNAERFRKNCEASGIDWSKVPKIYWETSNSQVLTMEYCPGIKISQVDAMDDLSVDRKNLARYAVESYLQQILKHGFFHADPHPGNLAVSEEGKALRCAARMLHDIMQARLQILVTKDGLKQRLWLCR